MKKFKFSFVLILPFLFLFSVACQNESSLVSPDKISVSNEEPNWISLPEQSNGSLMKVHKVTKKITVKKGGKISLMKKFNGGPHKSFEIKAEIKFRPNVVTKDTEFTMALDDKTGMLTISPAMTFNGFAALSVSLKGIDLESVDEDEIDFIYCDSNGQFIEVEYKKLFVNVEDGILSVLKVEAPHLTRFGYSR